MNKLKVKEWFNIIFLMGGLSGCICEAGWRSYQDGTGRFGPGGRHRNTGPPIGFPRQGHSSVRGYHPPDLAYYASNHNPRQGHAFRSHPRFHEFRNEYPGFGGYSTLHQFDHDIITGSPHDSVPFPTPVVPASTISLGPSHAGFLSASSTLRVADHLSKPPIRKGYQVTEDESGEFQVRADPHKSQPQHRPTHSSNHRSSDAHPDDSKATSYQSFILQSYKPVKVFANTNHESQDTDSNEISHKH